MTRNLSSRFTTDGADGWRGVSDVPASTDIQRTLVDRRMAEALEVARFARLTQRERLPARDRFMGAIGRLRKPRSAGVTAPAAHAAAMPGASRSVARPATGAAQRPACQG